ncbi:MAG: hypothetical protein EXR73_03000 [Myxococcales bacterium]|nr:hypothetical protein [Myxococcales bacterium]
MSDRNAIDQLRPLLLGIARALFMDRLHLLRLTEVVRNQIRPNDEGVMLLPPELDEEMRRQAFDFVLATFPDDYHLDIHHHRSSWLNVQ